MKAEMMSLTEKNEWGRPLYAGLPWDLGVGEVGMESLLVGAIAAKTKYHSLGGFSQQKFISVL